MRFWSLHVSCPDTLTFSWVLFLSFSIHLTSLSYDLLYFNVNLEKWNQMQKAMDFQLVGLRAFV